MRDRSEIVGLGTRGTTDGLKHGGGGSIRHTVEGSRSVWRLKAAVVAGLEARSSSRVHWGNGSTGFEGRLRCSVGRVVARFEGLCSGVGRMMMRFKGLCSGLTRLEARLCSGVRSTRWCKARLCSGVAGGSLPVRRFEAGGSICGGMLSIRLTRHRHIRFK